MFLNLKLITFIACLSFSFLAKAEIVELLSLPMNDGTGFLYSINQKEKCSMSGVNTIMTTELKLGHKDGALIENINLIQRKLNLAIETKDFNDDRATFSIKGATNIKFEFSYNKNCELVKKVHYNNKTSLFDEVNIEYGNTLNSPVIKKMTIIGGGNYLNIFIYPWALRGQIATYELNAGPALNIHSNIRANNLKTFEKTDPVIEPIPVFFFRYGTIFLNKNGLGSLVFHQDDLNILVMGLLEGEPYQTQGLAERKKGFFVGSIFKYNALELIYYNDFFKDKGYNFKINIAPDFYYNSNWKFCPQVFIQYWDNKYVDYYFGVKPEEASNTFRSYQGTHTLNYGTMFEAMHYIDKWTFISTIGIKHYGKEVYSSPTVTKSNEIRFISSVLYKFF
jgi:outer membrane protein